MKTYGHLRDQHSANMAQKVIFTESAPTNIVPLPPQSAQNGNGEHDKKAVAKAKAKHKYPWWASNNPLEIFWGQVNESVQIVPREKYLEATKAAMDREVVPNELDEPEALIEEFAERVPAKTLKELQSKIPQPSEIRREAMAAS
jgi:hypothetical protein